MVRWCLLGLLLLVVAVAAVGFFLPGDYAVERSVVVRADPEAVHELVGDLRRWDEWMPWKEEDPSLRTIFGAKTSGVGASRAWAGKEGSGSLELTAADEDTGIEYEMTFERWPARGAIRYERVGDGTKVTWSLEGSFKTPVVKGYVALVLPPVIGDLLDRGLRKLKEQVEK